MNRASWKYPICCAVGMKCIYFRFRSQCVTSRREMCSPVMTWQVVCRYEIVRSNFTLYWEQSWRCPGQLERKWKMKPSSQLGAGREPDLRRDILRASVGMQEQKSFCIGWAVWGAGREHSWEIVGSIAACPKARYDPPIDWLETKSEVKLNSLAQCRAAATLWAELPWAVSAHTQRWEGRYKCWQLPSQ